MCEMLLIRSGSPFSLAEVLPHALTLERYGIAGFGWGVAWTYHGRLRHFQSVNSLQADSASTLILSSELATTCLFHLRRPSLLSTLSRENCQPYVKPGRFAFSHNGFLAEALRLREEFPTELSGESDSEVGYALFSRCVAQGMSFTEALEFTAQEAQGDGSANLIVLGTDGVAYAVGYNRANRMFWYTSDRWYGVVTELHSADETVFKLLPWMTKGPQVDGAVQI